MSKCSNDCKAPVHRALIIPSDEQPPPPGQKDQRGVRIVRFCKDCWSEFKEFLPR